MHAGPSAPGPDPGPAPAPGEAAAEERPPDGDIEDRSSPGRPLDLRLFERRRRPPLGLIAGPVATITAAASIGLVANLGASPRVLLAIGISALLLFVTTARAYIHLNRARGVWIEGDTLCWQMIGRRRRALPLAQVRSLEDESAGLPRDRGRPVQAGPRPFQGGVHHLTARLEGGGIRRLFELLDMAPETRAYLVARVNRALARARNSSTGRGPRARA